MTDPILDSIPAATAVPSTAATPPAAARTPGSRSARGSRSPVPLRIVLGLIALGALGAAGYTGWQWWHERAQLTQRVSSQEAALARLGEQLSTLESASNEMLARQSDLSRLSDRNGIEIAALQSRIDDSLKLMSRISEDLSGGRTRFQLAAVEQLLLMANDRLLLTRDVKSAIAALESADARLASLSDPQLFPVRELLAQERTALLALPRPDLSSAALILASLIERVPRLPLASHAPSEFHAQSPRETAATDGATGWRRLVNAVQTTVRSLFTIRRDDNARALRLLPPETEAAVYHVLTLKLEGARVALLRGDTVALREQLQSTAEWLQSEFKTDDPGVLAMTAELDRLQTLELAPPLPDISRSLTALRARLGAAP